MWFIMSMHEANTFSRSNIALNFGTTDVVSCLMISRGASPFAVPGRSRVVGDKNS
jgi:hypothetical protein